MEIDVSHDTLTLLLVQSTLLSLIRASSGQIRLIVVFKMVITFYADSCHTAIALRFHVTPIRKRKFPITEH